MLTIAAVKAAAARERPYKMADAGGLYLHVATTGRRTWRMKYRYEGREQLLTFGAFPEVPLAEAREHRDAAKRLIRDGVDPSPRARASAGSHAGVTFETAARRWHQHSLRRWTPVHAADVITSLERDVFPEIGRHSLAEVDSPKVLRLLRAVEQRGSIETARRLRQRISAIYALAISEGASVQDPAGIIAKALQPPAPKRHQPALMDLDALRELMSAVERLDASPIALLASRFLALTAVRLASVRGARWNEFRDIDWNGERIGPARPLWIVPAARMKLAAAKKTDAAHDHHVPLSREAVEVLLAMRALGRAGELVFPGRAGASIGETAIGRLYDDAGYARRHVPHGWRASFSTILNERFRADRAVIDRALAHVPKDKVEAAYNRAEHQGRRRILFQAWGTLLLGDAPAARSLVRAAPVADPDH